MLLILDVAGWIGYSLGAATNVEKGSTAMTLLMRLSIPTTLQYSDVI